MPLWIKSSLVILLSIGFAAWFAGERLQHLHEHYLLENIREDKLRIVNLLAGLVANPVMQRDEQSTDIIVRQYTSSWPEMTYVHIVDDHAR